MQHAATLRPFTAGAAIRAQRRPAPAVASGNGGAAVAQLEKGARVRVTAPIKVFHVPKFKAGLDLEGKEGEVVQPDVCDYKHHDGKRHQLSANLPVKVRPGGRAGQRQRRQAQVAGCAGGAEDAQSIAPTCLAASMVTQFSDPCPALHQPSFLTRPALHHSTHAYPILGAPLSPAGPVHVAPSHRRGQGDQGGGAPGEQRSRVEEGGGGGGCVRG